MHTASRMPGIGIDAPVLDYVPHGAWRGAFRRQLDGKMRDQWALGVKTTGCALLSLRGDDFGLPAVSHVPQHQMCCNR